MCQIKVLVMDVDGTLTDGKVYMGKDGEAMKAFHIKDGYAIANLLKPQGILPVIITGRTSKILEKRCQELNITHLYQGVNEKLQKLQGLLNELGLNIKEAAYIGDDLNDLDCISAVGVSACPSDSASELLEIADYVCKNKGGEGAVREFVEYLLYKK